MSSILYREGQGTIEHGIECEALVCEPEEVDGLLANGWLANPPGYVPPEPVVAEEDPEVDLEKDDDADLAEQVSSLTAQVEILNEMDEKSQAEIARLNDELSKAEADIEALADENILLNELLNKAPDEEPPVDGDSTNDGEVDGDPSNLNPVRVAAKAAGIEGWDTKRIGTLENLLSEQ